jgi:pseudaminic acid cytidylyltransferase
MNPRILQLKTFIVNMLPHSPEGLEKLRADTSLAYVVPVVPYGYPIQRRLRILSGHIEMFQPEHYHTRSQELETAYHNAGQ